MCLRGIEISFQLGSHKNMLKYDVKLISINKLTIKGYD